MTVGSKITPGRASAWSVLAGLVLVLSTGSGAIELPAARPMTFHNRLLLNRAVVSGVKTIDVLLLVDRQKIDVVRAAAAQVGGEVRRSDPPTGYLRITLPTERLFELADHEAVDAYQIGSLSKSVWYRDSVPERNAVMFRGFETIAPGAASPPTPRQDLPVLSSDAAAAPGYTGGDETGVRAWLEANPEADGRGVTIALLENGEPNFLHPSIGTARRLDGQIVPKIRGIINAVGADEFDATRVALTDEVETNGAWAQAGRRTYILPEPGAYRLGLYVLPAGDNLVHQFGVVEHRATSRVWLDANGNADFRDEPALAVDADQLDVRTLTLKHPRAAKMPFVVTRGAPGTVHVYAGRGSHQTMTLTVAAGSITADSLARGVAPAARILLVRISSNGTRLVDYIEGMLTAATRPEVDTLSDSTAIGLVPDTAGEFVGAFFTRLVGAYGKSIFHGAGNDPQTLNSVSAVGGGFSVGASITPQTFAALYGGGHIRQLQPHVVSAAGPALDGAIKPDFLAPTQVLSGDLDGRGLDLTIPRNAPAFRLPAGHQIACCTSSSGPYAAGLAALLLSRARQTNTPLTVDTLSRALRVGARFLTGVPPHKQGNGTLDVNAAWAELSRVVDTPRIEAVSDVVHPLAAYSRSAGSGLFERDGWRTGMSGTRGVRLRRTSGTATPASYRVSWTGNDGTFSAPSAITLPLDRTVPLAVAIRPASPGVHGALLNLHDTRTDAVIFRTQVTIVAAEPLDDQHVLTLRGRLSLLEQHAHYVSVPEGDGAVAVDLTVLQGAMRVTLLRPHGLYPSYQEHAHPAAGRTMTQGRYTLVIPRPDTGTWTINTINDSIWRDPAPAAGSAADASYTITLRRLSAAMKIRRGPGQNTHVDISGTAPGLEPAADVSAGYRRTHRSTLPASGLPSVFEIDVPPGASSLRLEARAGTPGVPLDLHLFDCTQGECFAWTFTLPASPEPKAWVSDPKPGRWLAAVNSAPTPKAVADVRLDEILTVGAPARWDGTPAGRSPTPRWTALLPRLPAALPSSSVRIPITIVDLADRASERAAREFPWETRAGVPRFNSRAASIATAIYER